MPLAKFFIVVLFLIVGVNSVQAQQKFPEFNFKVSEDKSVTNQDFKDKYLLVNFFFATCPTICPTINGKVYTLQQEFKTDQLNFLSLNVDPENDTFEVIKQYAERFQAEPARWFFARPEKEKLTKLKNDLKLAFGEQAKDHNTRFILVKPDGTIYNTYQALEQIDYQELKKDLGKLLK